MRKWIPMSIYGTLPHEKISSWLKMLIFSHYLDMPVIALEAPIFLKPGLQTVFRNR